MSMPWITILFGGLLIALGAGTFAGTGSSHYTALIPAALGAVLAIFGAVSIPHKMRKHGMHGAVMVSLVGFIAAAVMAVPRLGQLISTGQYLRTAADGTQSDATTSTLAIITMGLLCLFHVLLCVRSFIQAARAARAARAAEAAKQA